MIETSTSFSQMVAESSRQFKARLLYGNNAVPGAIRNIAINKGACGDSFSVGSVYSSYIEVTLDECTTTLENKELLLQIGLVLDDDTIEYINMGYYTATDISRTAYQTTFTAVGRITSKLNCLPDSLPQETTLANLAEAITDTTGVTIACNGVTLAGTIGKDLIGLTCNELLEVITAVLGGFATENSAGGITISKFSTSNPISYNGERTTTDPQFSDYDYELSGIKVITTEEWEDEEGTVHPEVSFTEGTPRQTLSLQYMTQSLFSVFAENVVGFTYRPGTVPLALGDPRLEPWDTIKFTDVKGDVYIVPCLNITHSFDGGLSTTITAPGESESESETQSKGPLVKQLERVSSQLFTAEQAIVKRITADEADLRYATVESLNAAEANIENLSGSFASFKTGEFESLKTNVGEIEEAYIDKADIDELVVSKGLVSELEVKTLIADEGNIRFVQIDKTNIDEAWIGDLLVKGKFIADDINAATGSFSRYLTGVNIVGDNITGGTISTERLIIRDPDSNAGILYEINNGIVEQANLTEEQLKRLTLDGRIITAESITAEKINVADLFSKNITATGDFNLGAGGALVYDAETDTITIRASRISIGGRSAATTEEVKEEVKTVKNAALIEAYDEYATGSDKTTVPSSDAWSTSQPVAGNGIFIWQRRVSVYGNGDVVYGPAVCITGNVGEKGEDAAVLRIDSSRGTVFKNNAVATVLSVTVYYGSQRITNITDLRAAFGSGAYLEWKWQRVNEESFGTILSTDSRLSNDGFTFSLTPADVDTKVTFLCNLIV